MPSPAHAASRTFLRRHRVKRSRILFDVFAAAVRAPDLALIVLMQRKGLFETLVAVTAVIVVHGHRRPPDVSFEKILRRHQALSSCEFYFFSESFIEA